MKVPFARNSSAVDSIDHVITNISRDLIMSVHNEIVLITYGGREGSRAHAVAPVEAAPSGTAPRDADAR